MKILFLDVDGVLNCTDTFRRRHAAWEATGKEFKDLIRFDWPLGHLDENLVLLLNPICEQTDCKIVVSSTWRNSCELSDFKGLLKQKGFLYPDKIIGITPTLNLSIAENHRGLEIKHWLDNNAEVKSYCILDDDGFDIIGIHPNNYVHVRFDEGLTTEEVKFAIAMLNR